MTVYLLGYNTTNFEDVIRRPVNQKYLFALLTTYKD